MAKLTTRSENYSEWYNQIVQQAELAENSDVRGCMVIKPYGYAIWENIQSVLDKMFKKTWHTNAYFPLFVPKSYLSKEAEHIEGFAKECAVVTHHRLKNTADGKGVEVDPDAKLDEELIVRPTSETIIWRSYKNWIKSYRDLPILINQWANVVRWEMRTRAFLRTTEFLWQEWHTAHATYEEAEAETKKMLNVYHDFATNFVGCYSTLGPKPEHDKFPGAIDTYAFEWMMQDGKALQAGTSHFLGQTFAKAFDVTFTNKDNKPEHVWATSWGVTTRLIGGLIMAHSDDNGLVLPPALAPIHLVIVPIYKTPEDLEKVNEYLKPVIDELNNRQLTINSEYLGEHKIDIKIKIDDDSNKSPGWKYNEYELKGVPLRIGVGARDIEKWHVELYRRDTGEKNFESVDGLADKITNLLSEIQNNIYAKHKTMTQENTYNVDTYEEFKEKVAEGFVWAHWDENPETEEKIKKDTSATIRCIPFDSDKTPGKCVYTGNPSTQRVLFSRAY